MSNNEKLVNIENKDYYIRSFKGSKGFEIKMKIANIAASVGFTFDESSTLNIAQMVMKLNEVMSIEEQLKFMKSLVTDVYVGPNPIDFDSEFSGNMVLLYKIIYAVLEQNYGDVFQMLGISIPK